MKCRERKKEMKRVNITMSEWLLDELDYMAEKRGMSRSALLSWLVSDEFMKFKRNDDSDNKNEPCR